MPLLPTGLLIEDTIGNGTDLEEVGILICANSIIVLD
jgi:hypothetical protein